MVAIENHVYQRLRFERYLDRLLVKLEPVDPQYATNWQFYLTKDDVQRIAKLLEEEA